MNGLYLAPPHGRLIYRGKKAAIAKDRPWPDLEGEFVLCSDGIDGKAYGVVTTIQEGPLNAEEFASRFNDHRVTDKEQARWWPDGDVFYLYTIKDFIPFRRPLPVEVPAGVQTLMGEVKFKEADMPWKVFKINDEFCVYKVDSDGNRTGDSLGCHPTPAKAREQQAALYANEPKEKKETVLTETIQIDADASKFYPEAGLGAAAPVPFGVTSFQELDDIEAAHERQAKVAKRTSQLHQIVDNIALDPGVVNKKAAFSKVTDEYVDRVSDEECKEADEKVTWATAQVNNFPDSSFLYVEPGDKDKEGKTVPRSKRHLPIKDASGKVDLPHLRNAISRLGQPATGKGWLTEALRKRLMSKAQSMLKNAKEAGEKAGRRINAAMVELLDKMKESFERLRKWATYEDEDEKAFSIKIVGNHFITLTTNAFIDRDGEIFATDAIEKFVERHKEDETKGEVWYRHLKGSKFATTIFQGMQGRFLIEVHEFDDTPIGQAMKALLNDYPAGHPQVSPEGWGCSHGFYYDPEDRKDAIYEWFEKRETSVLPGRVASNPYTKLEVVPMDQKAVQELELLVGKDLATSVLTVTEDLTKELEGAVAFKEVNDEPAPEGPEEVEAPAEEAPVVEEVAEEAVEETEAPEVAEAPEEVEVDVTDKAVQALKDAIDFDNLVTGWKSLQEKQARLEQENTELKARLAEVERTDAERLAEKEQLLPRFPWSDGYVASQDTSNVAEKGDEVLKYVPPEVPGAIASLTKGMMK